MSQENNIISDYQSANPKVRGRPAIAPEVMLDAADKLFARAALPQTITMDAIAAAAGVGKGTLFRAFGSRDGLLDALWATKLLRLRTDVERDGSPLGPGTPSSERAVAFLNALLSFKLDNRHLVRAREVAPTGIRQSGHYKWMHNQLQQLIAGGTSKEAVRRAGYTAHVLLAALQIDLIEELLATGYSLNIIRHAQGTFVKAAIAARTQT